MALVAVAVVVVDEKVTVRRMVVSLAQQCPAADPRPGWLVVHAV